MSKTERNLKETISHGDSMLQLNVYTNQIIDPTIDLYLHWHEEVEIIMVEQGQFILNVNGQDTVANEGDIYFINKQQLHSAHCLNHAPSLRFAIVFNLSFLGSSHFDACQFKYLDPLSKGQILFPTHVLGNSRTGAHIKQALYHIRDLYNQKPYGFELGIKSSLFHVLSTLVLNQELISLDEATFETQSSKLNYVKKALDYLHAHYDQKMMMTDLANHLTISNEYLSRLFKAYTGKTPVEYLIYYRIEQAAKLLVTTDQTIIDIALQCGFDNISYFIKKFKHYKGLTPKQYQKTYGLDEPIALVHL
ncbi:MAG TPA: hypothetical protein DCY20_11530 [Firmicutes bacterium]|nr:hypothetical protein [Bacillota bacterium]